MTSLTTNSPDSFYAWVTDLVHRHRARLARVVRREGVRADDALDCVQEAFLGFLNLPQARLLVGLSEDSGRMLTILARNIARNRRRRHDYARPHIVDQVLIEGVASEAVSADDLIAAAEQYALTLGCIATLNDVQRAVVNLRLIDEIPGEDVASQLDMPPNRVAVLLFRAKTYLRSCVEAADQAPRASAKARLREQHNQGTAANSMRSLGARAGSGSVVNQQKARRTAG